MAVTFVATFVFVASKVVIALVAAAGAGAVEVAFLARTRVSRVGAVP